MQDLLMDENDLDRLKKELKFRGVKGATGTQVKVISCDHVHSLFNFTILAFC